jgi:hypothetical protein
MAPDRCRRRDGPMHDCGLYSIEDVRPVNELRMKARSKLGRALAKVERGKPGPKDVMSHSSLTHWPTT